MFSAAALWDITDASWDSATARLPWIPKETLSEAGQAWNLNLHHD